MSQMEIDPPAEHTGSTLLRGSAANLIAQMGGNLALFAAVLVISRDLGTSARGAVAFVTIAGMVVQKIANLGAPEAAVVLCTTRPRLRPSIATNLLVETVLSATVCATLLCLVLLFVPGARPSEVGAAAALSVSLGILGGCVIDACYGLMLGCRRFAAVPLLAVSGWLYALGAIGFALAGRLTVTNACWSWGVSQVVGALAMFVASTRASGLGRLDLPLLVESARFGLRAWLGSLARFLNFRADQWILAYLAPVSYLGLYAVSVNFSEVLLYVPNAAGTALTPSIAAARGEEQLAATLRAFRILTVLSAIGVAIAAVVGPILIPLILGAQFHGAIGPFELLLPGAFGWIALTTSNHALLAAGRPGASSIGIGVALVTGLVLDLALIPPFQANGAAAAATVAFFAGGLAGMLLYRRLMGFRWRELVPARRDAAAIHAVVRARMPGRLSSAPIGS
jgi:O-antigen/teichoic acid export membrane protein